jgi:hypothetical protein
MTISETTQTLSPEYRLLMGHCVDYRRTVEALVLNHPELLMQHMVFMDDSLDQEMVKFYQKGSRIEAIRYHREVLGSSLKEAKDYVDDAWIRIQQSETGGVR